MFSITASISANLRSRKNIATPFYAKCSSANGNDIVPYTGTGNKHTSVKHTRNHDNIRLTLVYFVQCIRVYLDQNRAQNNLHVFSN